MSQAPKDAAEHYLVIVRNRHGGGDDGHHGGAWKIAYADFMTAMMAFFLVMWLINATDEKTIIQVATYFNPLRLSDKVPSQKGLHEGTNEARGGAGNGGPSATGTTKPSAEPSKKDVASPSESKKKAGKKKTDGEADQQLFADPFASLDKIAAKVALAETPGDGKDKAANDPPPPTGEVVRDPYDPIVRPKGSEPARTTRAKVDETAPTPAKEPAPPPATASGTPGPTTAVAPTVAPTGAPPLPATAAAAHKETPQETAAKLEAAIRQAVAGLSGAHPMLNVTMTSEGVLIDLTDNTSYSMFAVGSAEPRAELVVVMARIGGILAKQSGPVVIRGHTDGRPYRTAAYDNWRLSSARAHMASYMLIRGGLSDGRIERIEGHADRALKVPIDKEAAQNRRIEILLKVPPS